MVLPVRRRIADTARASPDRTALIGFGTLCFTGAGSVVQGLGISQNPDVDFPLVNVSVTY